MKKFVFKNNKIEFIYEGIALPNPLPAVVLKYNLSLVSEVNIDSEIEKENKEKSSYIEQLKIDTALAAAWDYINKYYDQPAFTQMTDWKHTFADNHPCQKYIMAVETWKNAIMYEYLIVKKTQIKSGVSYDLDYTFIGEPPCKFTDIFLKVNTNFIPFGYIFPDVTNYTPGTRS